VGVILDIARSYHNVFNGRSERGREMVVPRLEPAPKRPA